MSSSIFAFLLLAFCAQPRSFELSNNKEAVVTPLKDYLVPAGQSARLNCSAIADSSLTLGIEWLFDNEAIDFSVNPRIVKNDDNSLTLSKATELDSGTYTCVARTEFDEARSSAFLIVQDVPNMPEITDIECHPHDATISWQPYGDNRSPITHYILQYSTSFTPDVWEDYFNKIPPMDFRFTVQMSPWTDYTFRVIAVNKIGLSHPSHPSATCTSQRDVPYKNPDNVNGTGTDPTSLEISWTPMPEIEHNAPDFHYRVSWRRDLESSKWDVASIRDWREGHFTVNGLPTFQKYRIKVAALNILGEANVAPREEFAYSGEGIPSQAPGKFSLVELINGESAIFGWDKVPEDTVNGHLRGYKIETWSDSLGEEKLSETLVSASNITALVTNLTPNATNYAQISVYNDRFSSPPSHVVVFKTPSVCACASLS